MVGKNNDEVLTSKDCPACGKKLYYDKHNKRFRCAVCGHIEYEKQTP